MISHGACCCPRSITSIVTAFLTCVFVSSAPRVPALLTRASVRSREPQSPNVERASTNRFGADLQRGLPIVGSMPKRAPATTISPVRSGIAPSITSRFHRSIMAPPAPICARPALPPPRAGSWLKNLSVTILRVAGRSTPASRAPSTRAASSESIIILERRRCGFLGIAVCQCPVRTLMEQGLHRSRADHHRRNPIGVEGRWSYYDAYGALRDMVQNHMLQLLCLVAMEPPARLDPDAVRDEKAKVLHALRPIGTRDAAAKTVRGQYAEGETDGATVPAYVAESGGSQSGTEIFPSPSRPKLKTGAGRGCHSICAPESVLANGARKSSFSSWACHIPCSSPAI